jgi:hypothetical protein
MKINVAMPDTYALRARLIPAIVAGAPAFALAAILVSWSSFNFTQLVAALGLTALFSVFSNVARTHGKAIEPGIYERMRGMPSTVMLRHSDNTFDAVTKAKMHAFLAQKLNEAAPTAARIQSALERPICLRLVANASFRIDAQNLPERACVGCSAPVRGGSPSSAGQRHPGGGRVFAQ